jgi:very long chain acyl-CoA dehydrogenase
LQSIEAFGQAVEATLIKYGRGVVDEQFILNRLASAAIDTYTMVVVLSRATTALQSDQPSAHVQELMTKVWCSEVRIWSLLCMETDGSTLSWFGH